MNKTRKRKREPTVGRLKLWQLGGVFIFAGVVSNVASQFFVDPGNSAEARGQRFGAAAAALLFIVIGVVLIIVGLIKRK